MEWVRRVGKSKSKVHCRTAHEGPEGEQRCPLILVARWGVDCQRHVPDALLSGKWPIRTVQEDVWVPQPVWTRSKNLSPAGIWSPDRPSHSESLYRLHCMKVRKEAVVNCGNISIFGEDQSLYPEVILCNGLIWNKWQATGWFTSQ